MLIEPLMVALLALSPPPGKGADVRGDCSLTVGKRVVINIKRTCHISLFGDGGFSINTAPDDARDRRPFHFAYLNIYNGLGQLSWNEDIRANHAEWSLGEDFRRKGGCWIGRRATVCAYRR